jgi:endonuclease/exonuclease/phosphatase family metal-dependent hydrolase
MNLRASPHDNKENASTSKRPAVIAGDLNATPDAPELQPLFSVFTDVFASLEQNEDYILTTRGATATSARSSRLQRRITCPSLPNCRS